jgi:hypothetical protein
MFKWIKMWLGIDEPKKPEPKKELPADFAAVAPIVDAMTPKPVDRTVEGKKGVNTLDPIDMLNVATGKKKKPAAKKPAKKATRMPNKLDKGK